ncbi:tyrosine-type recombinase/integrase [Candidatus Micrarchaeota archaeon]|nr:tyrosine-type recombinase/integrase [Candidatus Micrarchaeota archaeon]
MGETPAVIRWLKTKEPRFQLKKSDLISGEELGALLAACDTVKKRFFIAVLYESGARIGELLSATVGNVKVDAHGIMLSVDGKTGPRSIRLVTSAGQFGEYLNGHPERNNPDAPLFYSIKDGQCKQCEYWTAAKMMRRLFTKAGVSKEKAHFHLFRHSRAAETKRFMPEDYQRRFFGWAHGSDMPSHYGALDSSDLDNILLSAYGKAQRNATIPEIINRICECCHHENFPSSAYCSGCGWKLGLKASQLPLTEREIALLKIIANAPNYEQVVSSLPTNELEKITSRLIDLRDGDRDIKSGAGDGI